MSLAADEACGYEGMHNWNVGPWESEILSLAKWHGWPVRAIAGVSYEYEVVLPGGLHGFVAFLDHLRMIGGIRESVRAEIAVVGKTVRGMEDAAIEAAIVLLALR